MLESRRMLELVSLQPSVAYGRMWSRLFTQTPGTDMDDRSAGKQPEINNCTLTDSTITDSPTPATAPRQNETCTAPCPRPAPAPSSTSTTATPTGSWWS